MDDHAETDLAGDERERSHLPRIGLALTVLYLAGLVLYLFLQGQNPANLRLNALGDFVGGVRSPSCGWCSASSSRAARSA